MRKLREVLRLRFELKLGYQQIGRSCAIAVSTVHKYLKRAEAAGLAGRCRRRYRGCLGIIRLAEKYSAQRVEAASERALLSGACRYKSVESILKNSLDQVPPASPPPGSTPPHDNIRGSEYFE